MRRTGSGASLGSGDRPGSAGLPKNSMMRLPDEQPIAEVAAEGTGERPRGSSRPSSASNSPTASKAGLTRLPDDITDAAAAKGVPGVPAGWRPASSSGSPALGSTKASQASLASLSRLPDSAEKPREHPSPPGGGLRDRMKHGGLSINTKPVGHKERGKAFRALADGDSISNYYDFGDEIHDGGPRGRVIQALRLSDKTKVVIKMRQKKPERPSDERAWREVMTQIHSMRSQSQHVLDIFEILEDNKNFFIVMPMVEGGELFNFLVTEAEVPESECKRIIREILHALGHLHDNNLIHRDVKPENILFDNTVAETPKTVKLIDFDTCLEWTPMTPKSKSFVGTPGYIAPEALLGVACPQSDLWSVGVICYILMTGETPWTSIETLEDGTVGSLGANRMYDSLKSAVIDWESEPWPDFPLARDLCQKLMAFEAEERPDNVADALAHPWLST